MKKLLLSTLAIAVLAPPVGAQEAVSVAGTWNVTLETPQGTGASLRVE